MNLLLLLAALSAPTYTKDIKPIFKNRCSICHDGMADKNWQDYEKAFASRDKIKNRVLVVKDMPQGNITGMTEAERTMVGNWIDGGAKK
jgi:uncharacterized membrane protein